MGYMRHPRTTQERRANGRRDRLNIEGCVIKLRPSRNMTNLTDTYDDPWRRDWNHRSWKRHRKTQWKTESVMANDASVMEVSDAHTKHLDVAEEFATKRTNPGDDPGD